MDHDLAPAVLAHATAATCPMSMRVECIGATCAHVFDTLVTRKVPGMLCANLRPSLLSLFFCFHLSMWTYVNLLESVYTAMFRGGRTERITADEIDDGVGDQSP